MAYWDIAEMAEDADLGRRIQACAAQEITMQDPFSWVGQHLWTVVAAPGWDAAWASAVAGGNPNPGRDPAVITDAMILSSVQAEAGP